MGAMAGAGPAGGGWGLPRAGAKRRVALPSPRLGFPQALMSGQTPRCAHAGAEDGEPLAGAEVAGAAGPGVVGVGVGDEGAGHRLPGVDVEIARGAVESAVGQDEEVAHGVYYDRK